jgi:aryl-alcohol dehydrogenase-like predicted oxidoreductase
MPELIELVRAGRVDAVQVPYHPGERTVEAELLPLAAERGVGVIVMSPLESGRAMQRSPGRDELAPLAPFRIATWAQALLKWILSDPRVTCAIPATASPDHMRENSAAGTPPWLDAEHREYVGRLWESAH